MRFLSSALVATTMLLGATEVSMAGVVAEPDGSGGCEVSGSGTEFRRFDGKCNNLDNPDWGSADSALLRPYAVANYVDGISQVDDVDRPNPRAISNAVVAQPELRPNPLGATDMLMQWGQFLDHDLDLTHMDSDDPLPINIPAGDSHFSGEMPFDRSVYDHASGMTTPRQQVNAITAFVDASQIYGSDQATSDALRTFSDGKLKMSVTAAGALLDMKTVDGKLEFQSGDERVNEQIGLTSMHTLFNREHNRLAGLLATEHPDYDDETLFQHTRKLVGALMQAITYNEFLPQLLGSAAPEPYSGYDAEVNPGIANAFSTAAYRFGHSTLSPQLLRLDENGLEVAAGHVALKNAFFNPYLLLNPLGGGVEAVLRGLVTQQGQEIDPHLVDDVRNMLFGPPVDVGFDLAALNIQRGRDHGLPSFNAMREALGLGAYEDWTDAVFMPGAKEALMSIYDDVDDIDLWVGGLAENHVDGGMLGAVFAAIVSDQFTRLRDGDRFWYQNGQFEDEWLAYIEASTLSDIIMRNTDISGLQANVFKVPLPSAVLLLMVGLMSWRVAIARTTRLTALRAA